MKLLFHGGRWDGLTVEAHEAFETMQVEACDEDENTLALIPPEMQSPRNVLYVRLNDGEEIHYARA